MNHIRCLVTVFVLLPLAAISSAQSASSIPNPLIDYAGHRETVQRVESLRESRRLSEADFLAKSREAGTVVLDARSGPMFALLHLEGAVNLSFPDFTEAALAKVIPTKDTRVLIYCNNNFLGSPRAMATKVISTSLNISTYVALTSYGYTNVYELGPLLDVKKTVLPLAGSEMLGSSAGKK
ncbi:MAG: rhodanese-like domain-containing protein [Opitutaceae bacterium]|nr:rhodanese-like domain-containing protein [Opitutaceae bacterium]